MDLFVLLRIVGHSDPQLRDLETCVIYVHTHLIASSMSCELFTRHLWHHLHYPLLIKRKSSLLLPMKITRHHLYYLSLFEWNVFATSAILFLCCILDRLYKAVLGQAIGLKKSLGTYHLVLCCIFDRLYKAVLGPGHGPKKKPGHTPFGNVVHMLSIFIPFGRFWIHRPSPLPIL